MSWTRASELDRTLICPGSLILPRTREKSEKAQDAADWGTMVHRWVATGEIRAEPGRKSHPRLLMERLGLVAGEDHRAFRQRYWPEAAHEITVAVRVGEPRWATATYSGPDPDGWKASFNHDWVTGTIDYLGRLLGDLWVDDLKTGAWPVPVETHQLSFYGLAAWLIDRCPAAGVRVTITQWPRYPRTGLPQRTGRVMTYQDLYAFQALLVERHAHYLTTRDETLRSGSIPIDALVTGDHCTFCDSRASCPRIQGNNGQEDRS